MMKGAKTGDNDSKYTVIPWASSSCSTVAQASHFVHRWNASSSLSLRQSSNSPISSWQVSFTTSRKCCRPQNAYNTWCNNTMKTLWNRFAVVTYLLLLT